MVIGVDPPPPLTMKHIWSIWWLLWWSWSWGWGEGVYTGYTYGGPSRIPVDLVDVLGTTEWDSFGVRTAQCYHVSSSPTFYATQSRQDALDADEVVGVSNCVGITGASRPGIPVWTSRSGATPTVKVAGSTFSNVFSAKVVSVLTPSGGNVIDFGMSGPPRDTTEFSGVAQVPIMDKRMPFNRRDVLSQEIVCLRGISPQNTMQNTPPGVPTTRQQPLSISGMHFDQANAVGLGEKAIQCADITEPWTARGKNPTRIIWHGAEAAPDWIAGGIPSVVGEPCNVLMDDSVPKKKRARYFMYKRRISAETWYQGCAPWPVSKYNANYWARECVQGDTVAFPRAGAGLVPQVAAYRHLDVNVLPEGALHRGDVAYGVVADESTHNYTTLQPRITVGGVGHADEALLSVDLRGALKAAALYEVALGQNGRAMGDGHWMASASSDLVQRNTSKHLTIQYTATPGYLHIYNGNYLLFNNRYDHRMKLMAQTGEFNNPKPSTYAIRTWCGPQFSQKLQAVYDYQGDWHVSPHYGMAQVPDAHLMYVNRLGYPVCHYGFAGAQCEKDMRAFFPMGSDFTGTVNQQSECRRTGNTTRSGSGGDGSGDIIACEFGQPAPLTCADHDPCGGRGYCVDTWTTSREGYRTRTNGPDRITHDPVVPHCVCHPGWITPPMQELRNHSDRTVNGGPYWAATTWWETFFPTQLPLVESVYNTFVSSSAYGADHDVHGRPVQQKGAAFAFGSSLRFGGFWTHHLRASHQCTMWVGGTLYPDNQDRLSTTYATDFSYRLDPLLATAKFYLQLGSRFTSNSAVDGSTGLLSTSTPPTGYQDGGVGVYGAQPGLFFTPAAARTFEASNASSFPCAHPAGDSCVVRCVGEHAGPLCQPCQCLWNNTETCVESATTHDCLEHATNLGLCLTRAVHRLDTQCVCKPNYYGIECERFVAPRDAQGRVCGGPTRGFPSAHRAQAAHGVDPTVYQFECSCLNGWEGVACGTAVCPTFTYTTAYAAHHAALFNGDTRVSQALEWPCFQEPPLGAVGEAFRGQPRIAHGVCNHATRTCSCNHTAGAAGQGWYGDACQYARCPVDPATGIMCGDASRCQADGTCLCWSVTARDPLVSMWNPRHAPANTSSLRNAPTGTVDPTLLRYGLACELRWADRCSSRAGSVCGEPADTALDASGVQLGAYCGPQDITLVSTNRTAGVPRCWCPAYAVQPGVTTHTPTARDTCEEFLLPQRCHRHLDQGVELLRFARTTAWVAVDDVWYRGTHPVLPRTVGGTGIGSSQFNYYAADVVGAECLCKPGFVGDQCQYNATAACVDPRTPHQVCSLGGTCVDSSHNQSAFHCACRYGYHGTFCEIHDGCSAECFANMPLNTTCVSGQCQCQLGLELADASDPTSCRIDRCARTNGTRGAHPDGTHAACDCAVGSIWFSNSTTQGCRTLCPLDAEGRECGAQFPTFVPQPGSPRFCSVAFVGSGATPTCTCTQTQNLTDPTQLAHYRAVGDTCEPVCTTGVYQSYTGECVSCPAAFSGNAYCDPRVTCNGRANPATLHTATACDCVPAWAYNGTACEVDRCAPYGSVNLTANPYQCTCHPGVQRDADGSCSGRCWDGSTYTSALGCPVCPATGLVAPSCNSSYCLSGTTYNRTTASCNCPTVLSGVHCEQHLCRNGGLPARSRHTGLWYCDCASSRFRGDLCEVDRCPAARGTWTGSGCTCDALHADAHQHAEPSGTRALCTRDLCAPGVSNGTHCNCTGAAGFSRNATSERCERTDDCVNAQVFNASSGACVCPPHMDPNDATCATLRCDPVRSTFNRTSETCMCRAYHTGAACTLTCDPALHLVAAPANHTCVCASGYQLDPNQPYTRVCVSVCSLLPQPSKDADPLTKSRWCECHHSAEVCEGQHVPLINDTSYTRRAGACDFLHDCEVQCGHRYHTGGQFKLEEAWARYPTLMQQCLCDSPHCRRNGNNCYLRWCHDAPEPWLPIEALWAILGTLGAALGLGTGLMVTHQRCPTFHSSDFHAAR